VLTSLALMAAPSWAAKGGNSANAKLCEPGGYPGLLFNQHGESFKNEGQCTKAGAHGQLAGVNLVTGPVTSTARNTFFKADFSGFGFKPGTEAFGCVFYSGPSPPGGTLCTTNEFEGVALGGALIVAADGTFSGGAGSPGFPCGVESAPIDHLFVQALTASNVLITKEFPPPSGC
jgi:hypothetical protein